MDFDQLVRSSLDAACAGLLPSLESRFLAEQGCAPRTELGDLCALAVVGFSGDEVHGTLTVVASRDGLERVRRSSCATADQCAPDKALGDLARQVAGRFVQQLARHGIAAAPSAPLVVRGSELELCGSAVSRWSEFASSCGDDRLEVRVDARAEPDVSFSEDAGDEGVISEGEALLF